MFFVQDPNYILDDYNPIWNDNFEFWGISFPMYFLPHNGQTYRPHWPVSFASFDWLNHYFGEINEIPIVIDGKST